MKVVSHRLPLTLSFVLFFSTTAVFAADYSAQICALTHPQLIDAVEVSEGAGSGCQWSTADGGYVTVTAGDGDVDLISAQIKKELDELQASFSGVMGVNVSRNPLGVCAGDEMVEVTARGQSTVKGIARCGQRLLAVSAQGAGTPDISKAMVKAAQAAGW